MSFESFQLNLKLTNTGYNKVMALDGKPVALTHIALGKGNAAGTAGYNVDFRDTKTALLHEVVRKQIDSSQKTSYTDANGTPLARLDFAAIFNDNSSFDVWEMGFFDDVGDLIYIWSHPTNVFAPKRPNIHLAISISQHLLFAEEASGVIVQDAGVPFELFLQPLKDDFDSVIASAFSIVAADALNLMMRDIAHDEEIVSAKSRLATAESKLIQASGALPAINSRINELTDEVSQKSPSNHDHEMLMTTEERQKLSGIDEHANNYAHPTTHPASIIKQDADNRFVTDTEKSAWGNKADANHEHSGYAMAIEQQEESLIGVSALLMADSLLAMSKAMEAKDAIAQTESAIAINNGKIAQLQQRAHQHKEMSTLELIGNDPNSDTLMYRNHLVNPPTPPEIEMITPPRGFSMSMTTPPPEMTPEGGLVYSNINEVSFSVSEPALSLMPSDISYHWIVTPTDLTSPDRVHSIGGGVSFSETANEPKKLYCWAQNALGDKSKIIAVRG